MANTVTAFYTFSPDTKIYSSEVNTNFACMRGDFIPINTNTQTASDATHSLGLIDHRWLRGYFSEAVYLGAVNASGGMRLTPNTSSSGLVFEKHDGSSYVRRKLIGDVNVTSRASNHTVSLEEDVIYVDTISGGAFTLTLPPLASCEGKELTVIKSTTDFNACTIDADGSELIDYEPNTTVASYKEVLTLLATNVGWTVKSRKFPDAFSCTFTGSWVTNTTYAAICNRMGAHASFSILVSLSGAPTSATFTLTLPSGMSIDTSKMVGLSANGSVIGSGLAVTASGRFGITMLFNSPTSITVRVDYVLGQTYVNFGADVNATTPVTFANGDTIKLDTIFLPITNWRAS